MTEQKPKYKHICVYAPMAEALEPVTERRQTGSRTITKTKGFINVEKIEKEEPIYEYTEEWVPTGELSDVDVDQETFGAHIEEACNQLDQDGYKVISINPVLRGIHQHQYNAGSLVKGTGTSGFGYGFGYSITSSFMIIGELKD